MPTFEDNRENEPVTAPPRPRFRRLKRAAVVLLATLVVVVATYLTYQYSGEKVLERTIAQLDRTDRDWRIEHIEANRREVPQDKNSAVVVVKVYGLESGLGGFWGLMGRGWETEEIQKSFTGLEPQFQLSEAQIALLRPALQTLTPALTEARKLADLPNGRYSIDYARDGYSTLLPHAQGIAG